MDPIAEIFNSKGRGPAEVPTSEGRGIARASYASLPTFKKQENWKYRLAEDGGENFLGLEGGGQRYGWRFKGKPQASAKNRTISPWSGKRVSDPDDMSSVGKTLSSGSFQVHRADPKSLYGTMQDGKINNSIRLTEGEGGRWSLSPTVRKSIQSPAEALYRKATKKAGAEPITSALNDDIYDRGELTPGKPTFADILATPLVRPPGGSLAESLMLGAGLGAAGGAGVHVAGSVRRGLGSGENRKRPGLISRMVTGALVGGGISLAGNMVIPGLANKPGRLLPGDLPPKG